MDDKIAVSPFCLDLFPCQAECGDLVFFTRIEQAKTTGFEAAVMNVVSRASNVYHVAMLINAETIVHSVPSHGVITQSLHDFIDMERPDRVDLGYVKMEMEKKRAAVKVALAESGQAAYNDIFSAACVNSTGKRAFYCCQLICHAYATTFPTKQHPFLPHQLNFQNNQGEVERFWIDYFDRLRCAIPQDQPGSHPHKLHSSPCVKIVMSRQLFGDKVV